jgi:GTP-binding protein
VDRPLYTSAVTDTDRKKPRQGDDERIEASFVTSAPDPRDAPPDDRPEIALAGRSNAGKSSVLNRLTGNRQTAKVSKTPGRTQLLNFFDISRIGRRPCHGRLVDLPGYGYAKARREDQARWQAAVNRFLSQRSSLTAVVLVMDIRHPLQPFDTELIGWAAASNLPLLVLLNKADKLKHGAQQKTLAEVRRYVAEMPETEVLTFSALRGQNVAGLLDFLEQWLQGGEG